MDDAQLCISISSGTSEAVELLSLSGLRNGLDESKPVEIKVRQERGALDRRSATQLMDCQPVKYLLLSQSAG